MIQIPAIISLDVLQISTGTPGSPGPVASAGMADTTSNPDIFAGKTHENIFWEIISKYLLVKNIIKISSRYDGK